MKQLSEAALKVLKFRFLVKDKKGKIIETPEELFRRVATSISSAELPENKAQWENTFFRMMSNLDFLPNTPCLVNAGKELGELSACFVLEIPDTIEGIFDAVKHAAVIHRGGGGTGFNFSTIRPEGFPVQKTQGIASGPVSFINVFNSATEEIKQGGVRRGANMGILRIDHPDIEKFIDCKLKEGHLRNFNISVAVTDEFMTALKDKKKTFNLVWNKKTIKQVDPEKLWNQIVKNSWLNGEPGIIFIDTINKNNLLNNIETIAATNPCLSKYTLLLTPEGFSTVGLIKEGNLIWSEDGWVQVTNKTYSGIKDIYRFETKAGSFLGTKSHNIIENGRKVCAGDAFSIDGLTLNLSDKVISHKIDTIIYYATDKTYNITVSGDHHTFCSDNLNIANCIPKWGRLLTKTGIREVGEVTIGTKIWSGDGWVAIINKQSSGIQDVYEYRTNGGTFYGTKDHSIFSEEKKVKVKNAESIDQFLGPELGEVEFDLEAVVDGLLIGNGSWKYRGRLWGFPYLNVGRKDYDYYKSDVFKYFEKTVSGGKCDCWLLTTKLTESDIPILPKRKIPEKYLKGNSQKVISFLRGLFSANGFVTQESKQVGIDMVSPLIKDVQIMLSSVGIASSIHMKKSKLIKHKKGFYKSKRQHCLRIGAHRTRFYNLIGFIQKYKNNILHKSCETNCKDPKVSYSITEINRVSTEEVFDITVDGPNHNFWYASEMTANCGEQPLVSNGVCTLGSINLSNFISEPELKINWIGFKSCIRNATRFLDNVIDVSKYPLEQIADEAFKKRKIGLGIMGFADALIKLKICYNSEEAVQFAEKVSKALSEVSISESEKLGKEKGIPEILEKNNIKRRNGLTTTIAPTGSISIIAGCSSGCEPVFSFNYSKECISSSIIIKHPLLEKYLNTNSSIKELPSYFIESRSVSLDYHIKIQAAFQKHIHSGISKTINVKNETTEEEIKEVFLKCYRTGCKSTTVYRDGSRKYEALTDSKNKKVENTSQDRPAKLQGFTEKIKTSKGMLYVTVNEINENPFEVFLQIGKSGKDDSAYSEAIGRLISVSLRCSVSVNQIVEHLQNIAGDEVVWNDGQVIKSVPDAVAVVLRNHYLKDTISHKKISKLECPECESNNIEISESCITCQNCGWSKCS